MIELRDIAIDLGEFHLADLSLTIRDGEYMVLLGPTGVGKTVLVETVVGIHRPQCGAVVVAGRDVVDLPPEERDVGYVPQDYALFPNMTVRRNVAYGLEARGEPDGAVAAAVDAILADLGIAHLADRLPLNLSGGERQRVALGRALVTRPRILLLDEPLSALDENLRAELAAELRAVQQARGGTFLHVCHSFDEAADVADRVAIMEGGRIAQVGTIAEVVDRPATLFVARFCRGRNFVEGRARRGDGGGTVVDVGDDFVLHGDDEAPPGPVVVAFRPEAVTMVAAAGGCNRWRARVTAVRPKLTHQEMTLTGPVDAVAHLAVGAPAPAVGTEVVLHVATSALRFFGLDDGRT